MQDAYSLRCAPQVAGAARDTLEHATHVAQRELASAIDNPVITTDGRVESNGNFHGAPVGYVLDFLAIAVADVASMAERRTDRFLDKARSHGLPPFLADDPGVDSGYMIAQYTQAAIVSELKRLAVPASVDSIPSSAMQEDHVSMGWSAGRKLRRAIDGAHAGARDRAADRRARHPAARAARARRGHAAPSIDALGTQPGPDRFLAPEIAAATDIRQVRRARARRRNRHRRTGMKTTIRAARGTELSCRDWPQEAALRMLQNNLDPEVAEHPEELVVYGGTGKAARDWRVVRRDRPHAEDAQGRRDAADPVRQARRRDADPRVGAARAARELQPRRRLGELGRVPAARGARADDVRPDDRRLVDLHRHAGHPPGHLRDVRGGRRTSASAARSRARSR